MNAELPLRYAGCDTRELQAMHAAAKQAVFIAEEAGYWGEVLRVGKVSNAT